MFEFTEVVSVQADPGRVWCELLDIDRWWLPSNPEHLCLQVGAPAGAIGVGTVIEFEERVAGVKGRARGTVTRWSDGHTVTWEGVAAYRYFGIPITVWEGATWSVAARAAGADLSVTVWARFTDTLLGRVVEWFAKVVLKIVERDRVHARQELEFLKRQIEASGGSRQRHRPT